jgi:hypothetical protein
MPTFSILPTYTISAELREAFAAAADNDLYRVCQAMGTPAVFRRKDGRPVDTHAVVCGVAGGMFGHFADRELLPDGTLAERLDLSEHGLDWYLANVAE